MTALRDDAAEAEAWREANGCSHVHCPAGCEHPQERLLDGVMACGRCLVLEGVITPVLPCVPGVCED